MKVYGFDDTGPYRGELYAASIDAADLDFGLDAVAYDLGLEQAFTSFKQARAALVNAMIEADADAELVQTARSLRASYVPEIGGA